MKLLEVLVLVSLPASVYLQEDSATTTAPPESTTPERFEDRLRRLKSTTRRIHRRTTPPRVSFPENCEYLAFYCLKAYVTGKVCAKSVQFTYYTFKNYCMLDYVNCMERYDMWQPVHMGECIEIKPLDEYGHYPYDDDLFLDQYYIIEDV